MRKMAIAFVLSLLAGPALADTYNFGLRVITDGDSTGKLIDLAGKPDQTSPIENKFGARIGEKWIYYRDGKTITFTIDNNGKIISIIESR